MATLKKRVGEVAGQRFNSDSKVSFRTTDAIYKDLMEEMDSCVQKILLEYKEQPQPLPQTDADEAPGMVSMTPEPPSGPSVVVTPAMPFDEPSNLIGPPPITSHEESTQQILEGDPETEKKVIDLPDRSFEPPILATGGTDVEMADGSQVEAESGTS
ncbi:hypothetical protein H0H87_011795 [Tephrocybe sp. NHM501043]|nr:hypothetical protein H0H87_011795 [Tephrocybe sp. NHM501043]